jgi:hypothetical protein
VVVAGGEAVMASRGGVDAAAGAAGGGVDAAGAAGGGATAAGGALTAHEDASMDSASRATRPT